jgi:transposase-like protein
MELHKLHSPKNRFTIEEKHRAVKMYLSGHYTKLQIVRLFGVSYSGLDRWINKFGSAYLEEKEEDQQLSLTADMKKPTSDDQEDLRLRIAELEKKLEMAKLKTELLETMIDIAEEELHIPIRKKYGPQPSKEKHKNRK